MDNTSLKLRPAAPERDRRPAGPQLEDAYRGVLAALGAMGYPVASDDNFAATAGRAARAMLELVKPVAAIQEELEGLLARTFPAPHDDMVISKHNTCFGLCPHHLLPVIYRVSVAYLPSVRVLGLSKLSRIVHLLAKRPVMQEELTHDLAEAFHRRLESRGSAVHIEGLHLCMAARGVEAHESRVVTSAVRGAFREQATRQEFLALVGTPKTALL